MAYLGDGHWLRWRASQRKIDRGGVLLLVSPCGHSGHHEHQMHELTNLVEAVADTGRCDGGRDTACFSDRNPEELESF